MHAIVFECDIMLTNIQGVVTPIGTVVTAANSVKKWSRVSSFPGPVRKIGPRNEARSRGQEMLSVLVKWSRRIFKLSGVVKMQFRMVNCTVISIRNNEQSGVQKEIDQLEW